MSLKKKIKRYLFLDKQVEEFYSGLERKSFDSKLKAIGYIMRLNYAQYRQKPLEKVRKPGDKDIDLGGQEKNIRYFIGETQRKSVDEVMRILKMRCFYAKGFNYCTSL